MFRVVGIGELLWDLLPAGRQLGGAPANFACHAAALGASARLVSRIGNDDLGREALQRLQNHGVGIEAVQRDSSLPTSTVTVTLAADGQPKFTIHEGVAWDALAVDDAGRKAVADADAICFGTLGQRSEVARKSVCALADAAPPEALRIFDVNLRQHYYSRDVLQESLGGADVLKVNDTELPRLAELFQLSGDDRKQVSQLVDRFELRVVACTRGAQGSLLFRDGQWSDGPGRSVQVRDTVGAGDAFTAAMTLGLLADWPLDEINQRANELAAYVCSQSGATPEIPAQLRAPFQKIRAANRA